MVSVQNSLTRGLLVHDLPLQCITSGLTQRRHAMAHIPIALLKFATNIGKKRKIFLFSFGGSYRLRCFCMLSAEGLWRLVEKSPENGTDLHQLCCCCYNYSS